MAATGFEKQLSAIKAVSGATKAEMGQLADTALRIGKDTAFSASQAAGAIEELVKAGIPIKDVLDGAADAAVNLAAAGGVDIPTAAMLASNAMNAFGLTAKDMTGAVDLIAGAANASAIDVGQFGQSLQMVGAVANLAGVSFNDTATAIALMGNAGIKGSDAGTSLKTMLINLQPKTEKATEAFNKLGIITAEGTNRFINAKGEMKSLAEISGILKEGTSKLTDAEKLMALEMAFGTDAVRAAAIMSEAGAEGFADLNAEMLKTSAADVAATRMDNMAGSIEELKGSLETLAIKIGMKLLPIIRELVEGVTVFVNYLMSDLVPAVEARVIPIFGEIARLIQSDVLPVLEKLRAILQEKVIPAFQDAWEAMKPLLEKGLKFIADHKEMLVGALAAIGIVVMVTVVPAFIAWAAATVAATWPILAIIAAGAALALAIKALIVHWDDITAAVGRFRDKIMEIPVLGGVITTLAEIFTTKIQAVIDIFKGIIAVGQSVIDFFKAVFRGDWEAAWTELKDIASGLLDIFLNFLRVTFLGTLLVIFQSIKPWEWVQAAFAALKDGALGIMGELRSEVSAFINNALSLSWVSDMMVIGKEMVSGLWSGIESLAGWLYQQAFNFGKRIFNAVKDGLGKLWPFSPSEAGKDVVKGLIDAFATMQPAAEGQSETLGGAIAASISDGMNRLFPLWVAFVNRVQEAMNYLRWEMARGGLDIGLTFAQSVAQGITDGTGSVIAAAVRMVLEAIAAARAAAESASPSRVFMRIGESFSQGLALGMNRGTPLVAAAGVGMTGAAAGSVDRSDRRSTVNTFNLHMTVGEKADYAAGRQVGRGVYDELRSRGLLP